MVDVHGMIAVYVPKEIAKVMIADSRLGDNAESPSDLHVTIAYLGTFNPMTANRTADTLANILAKLDIRAMRGSLGGIGRFPGSHIPGKDVVWCPVDLPGLIDARELILSAIGAAGFEQHSEHGYTPHVTLGYVDPDTATPHPLPERGIEFGELVVEIGHVRRILPLNLSPENLAIGHAVVADYLSKSKAYAGGMIDDYSAVAEAGERMLGWFGGHRDAILACVTRHSR